MSSLREAFDSVGVRAALPDDVAYAEARLAHQRAADQWPEAVVYPTTAQEVAATLAIARERGLSVTVQAGGHGANSDLRGSVLLRLDAFDRLVVDTAAGTATVGAGVRAGAVAAALDGTGLLAALGTSPLVSLVGLVANGGHSWLSAFVGLSAQTVRRFHVVLPDGSEAWVDDDSDPELMRVLRGAAGTVAVVLEVEVDLLPTPALTGGSVSVAASDGPAIWRAGRDAAAGETVVFLGAVRLPDLPMLPPEVRGTHTAAVSYLSPTGAVDALAPVLAVPGVVGAWERRIEPSDLGSITNDSPLATASAGFAAFVSELPDELIDALFDLQRSDAGSGLVLLGARPIVPDPWLTGRPSLPQPGQARWLVQAIAPMPPGVDAAAAAPLLARLDAVIQPWRVPGMVPSFLGLTDTLADALDADALALVHDVRTRLDADVIRPTRLA